MLCPKRAARSERTLHPLAAVLLPTTLALLACGVCDPDGCSLTLGNTTEGTFDVRALHEGDDGKVHAPILLGEGMTREFSVHSNRRTDETITQLDVRDAEPEDLVEFVEIDQNGTFKLRGKSKGEGSILIEGKEPGAESLASDSITVKVVKPDRARVHACKKEGEYVRGHEGPIYTDIKAGRAYLAGRSSHSIKITPEEAATLTPEPDDDHRATFTASEEAPDRVKILLGEELERPGELEVPIIDIEEIDELVLALKNTASSMYLYTTYELLLLPYHDKKPVCLYGKSLLTITSPGVCAFVVGGDEVSSLAREDGDSSKIMVKMLAVGACTIAATMTIGELVLETAEAGFEMEVKRRASSSSGDGSYSGGGGFSFD